MEINCEGPNIPQIYVDYNATTPLEPDVVAAVNEGLYLWANPSSNHPLSSKAAEEIDVARTHIATLLNVEKHEVIFTSGGTESNNWIIHSAVSKYIEGNPSKIPHVICSAIEHPSILNKLHDLVNHKIIELSECDISLETGVIDLDCFEQLLRDNTCLVTVMLANNETGVIQPIRGISDILKKNEAKLGGACFFHTDASQAIGKMKVDLVELGADALTVVGHKFYGPRNGALIVREPWKSLYLKPLLFGGNQEFGFRSGTENTPMIMGLGAAAKLSYQNIDMYNHHLLDVRDYFEERLNVELPNNYVVNFKTSPRLPNTSSVSFHNYPGNACELLESCKAFLASTGAACHTGAVSAILTSCGVAYEISSRTIRFSFGRESTKADVATIIAELKQVLMNCEC
ncbi:unnamed protein product [Auanema sp. JU1783]|nr:unnamed protein product [Auanema sp. JU1783]